MVNERYDNGQNEEHHEEGEYHFSDDQVNYEMDPESVNADGTVVAAAPKSNIVNKLKQNRRIMIGVVVFFILIGLVYKLLVPASTSPSTEISQQNLSATTVTPSVTAAATTTKTVTKVAEHHVIPVQSPLPAETPAAQPAQTSVVSAAPAATQTTTTTTTAMPQQQIMPPAPAASTTPPAQQPTMTATVQAAPAPVDTSAQNNAAMNLLQTEYSQKIAENERQVSEMKTQLQELNSRVAGMEVSFHQLTKILRSMHTESPNAAASENGESPAMVQPMRSAQSHVHYTVQAIIPGRAWLKSDAGDTVTVAEGDELKDVGRITKIDPYDGIVNIDTGSKIITLSYGVTGD